MQGYPTRSILLLAVATVLTVPIAAGEPAPKEPERNWGALTVSFEHRTDDSVIRQYELPALAQLSYLAGTGGVCAVVDPQRDVDIYVRDAEALGLRITAVILTHVHTDFVAGHAELTKRTGACVVRSADLERGWQPLAHGASGVEVRPLEGGARDALLARLRPDADGPTSVFTGDTLLVGTVASPEDTELDSDVMSRAEQILDAVQALSLMEDETRILPGHGAGRFGGRTLAPCTVTSLARERAANPFLPVVSRAAFLGRVLDRQVWCPASFAQVAALNRAGPPLLESYSRPTAHAPAELPSIADAWLVDVRSTKAYAAGHVLGSVNIPVDGPFEAWVAAVVPFDARLVLIGDHETLASALDRLPRIGYRGVGVLEGGMQAWKQAGRPVARCDLVEPRDLERRMAAGIEPLIVDVRSLPEIRAGHIESALHVPLHDRARLARILRPGIDCLMVCKSGYRSSIAVGLAERMGLEGIAHLAGGFDAWKKAQLPWVPGPSTPPDAASAAGR